MIDGLTDKPMDGPMVRQTEKNRQIDQWIGRRQANRWSDGQISRKRLKYSWMDVWMDKWTYRYDGWKKTDRWMTARKK